MTEEQIEALTGVMKLSLKMGKIEQGPDEEMILNSLNEVARCASILEDALDQKENNRLMMMLGALYFVHYQMKKEKND